MSFHFYWIIILGAGFLGGSLTYILTWVLTHPNEKRKKRYGLLIGESVKAIPVADLIKSFTENPALLAKIEPELDKQVDHFLRVKLAEKMPMISMFIGEKTISQMKEVLMGELNNIVPALLHQLTEQIEHSFDLEKIVSEKMDQLSVEVFGIQLRKITAKPAKLFIYGGFLGGLLIGLLQALLIYSLL